MTNPKKPEIKTKRLVLRGIKESDIPFIFRNWANDPDVTRYLTWNPHGSIEVTGLLMKRWIAEEADPRTVRYMITLKGSDEPFGSIDVVDYADGIPEIGYCLAKKLWGNGYMTEACMAFLENLRDMGFTKAAIRADVNNVGSNRVIQKCGFVFTHQEYLEHASPLKAEPATMNWYEKEL